jgi:hypothetical protein|tara:strand:- start:355 stop:753 length:399 start_codon:yes stop_codon:yes gene_type:complete
MNILDHEVLTEKLQKKPNKSYIQKVQQFEGNKTMSLKKFQATARKLKPKFYLDNYFKRDISLIDMGLEVEADVEIIHRYVGGMLIQQIGKKYYTRYYNSYKTWTNKSEAEKHLYSMISEHIVSSYNKFQENQ